MYGRKVKEIITPRSRRAERGRAAGRDCSQEVGLSGGEEQDGLRIKGAIQPIEPLIAPKRIKNQRDREIQKDGCQNIGGKSFWGIVRGSVGVKKGTGGGAAFVTGL